MTVQDNLEQIKKQITEACLRTDRNPQDIHIVAVTKYVSIERAKEAVEAGVIHIGENRDEGLLAKYEILGNDVQWHFIGTLQSRKVKNIIDKVDYIHSLDRLSLAKEIHIRAHQKVKCFVQVNVSEEDSKHGLHTEEAVSFIRSLEPYTNIEVVGLMTMAPFTEDRELIRNCFRSLKQLQQDVQALNLAYAPCTELSMGMSNDYEIAVEEGATFIRLGTTLVGKEF
ncbi:YggS family pyridoxal phosphate-dependent enzyme [Bacillus songklensis]|uniref:Pyridoxal phosphate homeostasis protein n=1 Tax=Bacillus songklensis TaxID=1069116 RepID=A0ABV8AXF6_9BACI